MAQQPKTDRPAILECALELLAQAGLGGMTIRAVANALDLAPNAIYHYFKNLDALRNTVAAQVCGRLLAILERACKGQPPVRSIRALAEAYLIFARDDKYLYEALLLPRPEGEDAVVPERLWSFVVSQVRRVSGEKAAPEAAVALWAALHGLASLQSTEAFNAEKPRHSIDFAIEAWIMAAKAAALREPKSPCRPRDKQEVFAT